MDDRSSAELAAMQAMTESVNAQSRMLANVMQGIQMEITKLSDKMDDVQSRLIRVEEQRHGNDISELKKAAENLSARISALELSRAQAQGAGIMANALRNWVPLILAGVFSLLTAWGFVRNP